jgi:hypothetical protein
MYRKPNHTGPYLHFKPAHLYHVIGVEPSKVTLQDQKDFNNEIRNIRRDLLLNKYPKVFVHSITKPSTKTRFSSVKIFEGTFIISCIEATSEKFRRIGNIVEN